MDSRKLDAADASVSSESPSSAVNALNPAPQSAGGPSGPAPVLAVMPVDLDLGAMLVGYASIGVVTVGNAGNAAMDAPSVALSPATSSDFTILQDCEDPIDPGGTCSVRVQLVPHAVGDLSGSLQIASTLAGSAAVTLHGSGLNANGDLIVGSVDGSSFQFGNVLLGQTQPETFTITNPDQAQSGAIGLTIANPDFQLVAPAGNDCVPGVTSLASGGNCTVHVNFTPNLHGLSQGALVITSPGAGNGVQSLEGVGVAPASLQSSRSTLDFGGGVLNQPTPAVVTLTNVGDQSVQFSSVAVSGANADSFGVSDSACTGELKTGATCDITVQFQAAALGDLVASLDVQSNAPALSVPLTGTGLQPGSLVIAPVEGAAPAQGAPYDFGGVLVGSQSIKTFHVSNPAVSTSGFLQDIHASGDFTLVPPADGDCNQTTSLANGQSCNVQVAFSPSVRDTRSGTLTVTSVAAGSQTLALTGKGTVAANLASSPNTIVFGDVVLGQVRTSTVTVSNGGDEASGVPSVAITGAGASAFSVTANTCTQALASGQTCQVTVQFAPTSSTNQVQLLSPSLQIVGTPGGSANVALSGRGLIPGSLQIAAAGGSTAFQAASGSAQTIPFMLSNPGGTNSGPIVLAIVDDQAGSLAFSLSAGGMPPCQSGMTALDGGQSCGFNVTFTPPASGGAFSGSVSVSSRSAGNSTLAVSGTGQSAPSLATATARPISARSTSDRPALTSSGRSPIRVARRRRRCSLSTATRRASRSPKAPTAQFRRGLASLRASRVSSWCASCRKRLHSPKAP